MFAISKLVLLLSSALLPETISAKKFKLPDSTTDVPSKCAEISRDVGDDGALVFYDNTFNFENFNITEVIMFLQKLAKSPNGSKINRTFTEHIIKALMHAREEKLKQIGRASCRERVLRLV